jgi:hypothetical protein
MSNIAPSVIVPTDVSLKIREIETAYSNFLNHFRIPNDHKIVVNYE